ncbi:MAG: hypothetical protein NT159_16525, partial [Proteobacteria bacterium]|nr:hypothetical protein [Pseudomonadota bacterium]
MTGKQWLISIAATTSGQAVAQGAFGSAGGSAAGSFAGSALFNTAGSMGSMMGGAGNSLMNFMADTMGVTNTVALSMAQIVPVIGAAVAAFTLLMQKGGGPQGGQLGTVTASGYVPTQNYSGGDVLSNGTLAQSAYNQVAALYLAAGKSITGLAINQGGKIDPQGTSAALGYRQISIGGQTIGNAGWDNPAFQGAHDDATGLANYLAAMPNYLAAQAAQKALLEPMLTGTEKLTAAQEALANAGLPNTQEAFKSLISGLDLTTQAGQDTLKTMIALKGALDVVTASGTTLLDAQAKVNAALRDIGNQV